jgi:UDP-N-acetyl-D-mannosaminuronic acid dehydrogenase
VVKPQIPIGYKDRTVCILGLGFVGLTLAAIMAEAGFHIVGVEIREDVLKKLESGIAHFYEPGLTDAIRRAVKNDFSVSPGETRLGKNFGVP